MFIVNCEITEINDTYNGQILLKPEKTRETYTKIFDTKEEVSRFLIGIGQIGVLPTVQV